MNRLQITYKLRRASRAAYTNYDYNMHALNIVHEFISFLRVLLLRPSAGCTPRLLEPLLVHRLL